MNLTRISRGIAGLAILAAGVVVFQASVVAQDNQQQDGGQSARAVRLSYVDGQVSLSQGDQVVADEAVANTPLFEGMQLSTADDGKAEIQFEDGSVARIAPDSSLTISVLRGAGDSADAELSLDGGLGYFEFQGGRQAGRMSVRFGSSAATTSGFTALRISMDTPPGNLAVFSGNVRLEMDGAMGNISADLHGGESIGLNAVDPGSYSLAESIEPNSWDTWNSDRDEELTAEAAQRTDAPADVAGDSQNPAWNDLDANGSWYNVPGQGYVWSPNEAASANFDPYGNGDWIDSPSYGYVWVSGYPWGYLPYQCGAWNFYRGFGWGWSPGTANPWWRRGGYGGPNIGAAPVGYGPVSKPSPPRRPIGRPIPMIAVNRHPAAAGSDFPARDASQPVTIAGSAVYAMQPLPMRPPYMSQGFASDGNRFPTNGSRNGNTVATAAWYGARGGQAANQRPVYPRPIYTVGGRPAGDRPTPLAPWRTEPQGRSFAPGYIPPRAPQPHAGSPPPNRSSGGGAPRGSGAGGGGFHSSWSGGGGSSNSGSGGHH